MLRRVSTRGRILLLIAASALPMFGLWGYVLVEALFGVPASGMLLYTGAAAGATVGLVFAAWHGAERFVLAPIRCMLDTTRRVGSGELSARTGIPPTAEELSQLAAALDAMAAQLEKRDRELRAALRDVTQQAMTDALTGLYNRRFFRDALDRCIAAARRRGSPVSVILLDLDRFKAVNDACGHPAGDVVLKTVARVLKQSIRGSDIAVRHGGEEFAVLLPDTPLATARDRAEALREAIESEEIVCDNRTVRITASFGIAQYGPEMADAASLMQAVDEAMYAAKAAGRNCIVTAGSRADS